MFSHVMIGTNDLEKAEAFYEALLGTLGVAPALVDRHRIFYRSQTGVFSVTKPIDGKPAVSANGVAYLRDHDGNKLCALHWLG